MFLNGVLLQEGASNDYTKTTSAVTIVGTAPADGDILKVDVYESITIWDTVSASSGGTFSGGITGTTIDATTDFTIGGTVITDNTITDDGTLTITATTGITLGQDTALSAGKDLETSTTGKIKQKGSAFQSHITASIALGV